MTRQLDLKAVFRAFGQIPAQRTHLIAIKLALPN
jgi:hypothetical protein